MDARKADVRRKEEEEEDERDRKGFEGGEADLPIRELLIRSGSTVTLPSKARLPTGGARLWKESVKRRVRAKGGLSSYSDIFASSLFPAVA